MSFLAQNLKYIREKAGYTKAEMHDRLGIQRTTWDSYEKEAAEPNIDRLIKIAKYFGVELGDLLSKNLSGTANLSVTTHEKPPKSTGKSTGKSTSNVVKEDPETYSRGSPNNQVNDVETLKQMLTMKDQIITAKEELLESKDEIIHALKAKIDGLLRESRAGGDRTESAKNVA